ncbi:hypothetical protein, partial [Asticcacaulis sp.]|uniref:hypothetical protein n=1 Tax=Asticcacaulis sp. TaxID=1872648 RepID=UPI00261020C7
MQRVVDKRVHNFFDALANDFWRKFCAGKIVMQNSRPPAAVNKVKQIRVCHAGVLGVLFMR